MLDAEGSGPAGAKEGCRRRRVGYGMAKARKHERAFRIGVRGCALVPVGRRGKGGKRVSLLLMCLGGQAKDERGATKKEGRRAIKEARHAQATPLHIQRHTQAQSERAFVLSRPAIHAPWVILSQPPPTTSLPSCRGVLPSFLSQFGHIHSMSRPSSPHTSHSHARLLSAHNARGLPLGRVP